MRPPSAGGVSAETVSVPLGGRRQVHLQQGELLGRCRRRRQGETFALEAESALNIPAPADHRPPLWGAPQNAVVAQKKRRDIAAMFSTSPPSAFSVTPATETAAFKTHFSLFFFCSFLKSFACLDTVTLRGRLTSSPEEGVVCGAKVASQRSAAHR